jgi:putative spermidine/putrescine transport system substrate-binding protein
VDPANVYTDLATPEGVDRAFKALDKIKVETYWWDAAQEQFVWLLEK